MNPPERQEHAAIGPLTGVRVIDCSVLGPGALAMHLADLGAEVIKVEGPGGDPLRSTTWPMVGDVSLMHLHINRSKQSVGIDLRTEAGARVFEALVCTADVVIEGMRPGALERLGLGYQHLRGINPRLVFCSISGFGSTGPYRNVPSHGVAFDAWAGLVVPAIDESGDCSIPEHASVGIHAGPLFGALGVTAALLRSRACGEGTYLEIAQADAAAAMDWLRSETWMSYGNDVGDPSSSDGEGDGDGERRAPGTAGMRESVRYQFYATCDHRHVLFMGSDRRYWRNFCEGVGRLDLYERWPGRERGDHASGNAELREQLRAIFARETAEQWARFAASKDTAIVVVNTPEQLAEDPQFQARFPLYTDDVVGTDQLPSPLRFLDAPVASPDHAPTAGQHTSRVLGNLLGFDDEEIQRLRDAQAIY